MLGRIRTYYIGSSTIKYVHTGRRTHYTQTTETQSNQPEMLSHLEFMNFKYFSFLNKFQEYVSIMPNICYIIHIHIDFSKTHP